MLLTNLLCWFCHDAAQMTHGLNDQDHLSPRNANLHKDQTSDPRITIWGMVSHDINYNNIMA
jgi:hypothetical protein